MWNLHSERYLFAFEMRLITEKLNLNIAIQIIYTDMDLEDYFKIKFQYRDTNYSYRYVSWRLF